MQTASGFFCGFYDNHVIPHLYLKCSFFHLNTKPPSVDHETITKLRNELVAANQKIDKLEKIVQALRTDIPSLVQPTLDTKEAAFNAEKLEMTGK